MKTETAKKKEEHNDNKVQIIIIDKALEKERDKIYFPKKLEEANQMLETAKLPALK